MIDVIRGEAPPSLAQKTSWRGSDVRTALRRDFADKCYLCEGRLPDGWDVEHLHPRAAGGGAFDWENLFPACHMCNLRRLKWGKRGVKIDETHRAWPKGGMLNPTDGEGSVCARLRRSYTPGAGPRESEIVFAAVNGSDCAARNTAEELQHLFMDGEQAELLRGHLLGQVVKVQRLIHSFLRAPEPERELCRKKVVVQLSRRGLYSRLICAYLPTLDSGLFAMLGLEQR